MERRKKWRAKRAERESGEVPFPPLPSPPPDCFVALFFHRFIRFLPFYPITVTEPDSRLIKRFFESGATGESTSSIRGGGGGEGRGGEGRSGNGHQGLQKENLSYNIGD